MKHIAYLLLFLPFLVRAQTSPDAMNTYLKTAPVVTSLASLTASKGDYVSYKGALWVKTVGTRTTSSNGYPGAEVPGPTGFYYKKVITNGRANVLDWCDDDSTTNDTPGMVRARAFAKAEGLMAILPKIKQKYLLDPQQLTDGERIYGADVEIKRTSTRGYAFYGNVNNVIISGVKIDCNASAVEGAFYLSGKNNTIQNFEVRNGDQSSVVISGAVFNSPGTFADTRDNVVKDGFVTRQKKYHEGGGKSPLIAGDRAKNTLFLRVVAADNGPGGISIDDFDSDFADGTIFQDCHVRNSIFREGAGIYAEGEQVGEHQVTVINCTVTNKRLGFAASENARMSIRGGMVRGCKSAVTGLNNIYRLSAANVTALKCGSGQSALTEGVFQASGPMELVHCRTDSTLGPNSIANYAGLLIANGMFQVKGGDFDKPFRVAYENGGNALVTISDFAVFRGGLYWYNGTSIQLDVSGAIWYGQVVTEGSRIKRAHFRNIFGRGNTSTIAFNLINDSFNTTIENSVLDTYSAIGANLVRGMGVATNNFTTPVPLLENTLIRGTDDTRSSYYGNWTDELPTGVYTSPGNVSGAPFNSPYPFIRIVTHETNGSSSRLGHPSGWWVTELAFNINEGGVYFRRHKASGEFEAWRELVDKVALPLAISTPTNGQFLKKVSAGWQNATITPSDISYVSGQKTYTPGTIASGARVSTTVTATGAAMGQVASASFSLPLQGVRLWAEVTATNTITFYFENNTGGSVTLAEGTLLGKIL